MDIQINDLKRCTVVKTNGRIDGSTAKNVYNIVFDMSEVNFVASAGWWVLIDTQKTCKPNGEVVLVQVEKGIRDSLNLVGMGSYFTIFEDLTTAVGSF